MHRSRRQLHRTLQPMWVTNNSPASSKHRPLGRDRSSPRVKRRIWPCGRPAWGASQRGWLGLLPAPAQPSPGASHASAACPRAGGTAPKLTLGVECQARHKAAAGLGRQISVSARFGGVCVWRVGCHVESAVRARAHAPKDPLRLPRRPAHHPLPWWRWAVRCRRHLERFQGSGAHSHVLQPRHIEAAVGAHKALGLSQRPASQLPAREAAAQREIGQRVFEHAGALQTEGVGRRVA